MTSIYRNTVLEVIYRKNIKNNSYQWDIIRDEEEGTIKCLMVEEKPFWDCNCNHKEQEENQLGLRGAFGGGMMGPVQFNDEYDDIDAYRER